MVLLAEPVGDGEEEAVVLWGRWVDVPQWDSRGETVADPEHDPMWVASYAAIYVSPGGEDPAWHLKPVVVFPTHWMPVPPPPTRRTMRRRAE